MKTFKKPTCNLLHHSCNPVIPKGKYKCEACFGTGLRLDSIHYKRQYLSCTICAVCGGKGHVDWIKFITKPDFETASMERGYPRWLYSFRLNIKCPYNKKCNTMTELRKAFNYYKKRERNYELIWT